MVTLSTAHDYVVLFAIAAAFGALGGIAYELTQAHHRREKLLVLPSVHRWTYINTGFLGSMFLGAAAAVAISYFFTPEVEVKAIVHGTAVVQTEWQIVKVVPLSLIVGSSGGAFLEAMRSRVLANVNAQKIETTRAASKAAVAQVASVAKSATQHLTPPTAQHIASQSRYALKTVLSEDVTSSLLDDHENAVTDKARAVLDANAAAASDMIDASVEAAYRTIDAAAK